MQQIYTKLIIGWLIYMACCYRPLVAQTNPVRTVFCGAPNLTRVQALSLVQQANLALQRKRASRVAFTDITYVPLRPHIVRRSNGTGGIDIAGLNQRIAFTNSHFINAGIQFYFAGDTPDYIDSDQLFASFPYPEGSAVDSRDAPNAMNQYYVYQFSANIGGNAYYPSNSIVSTRSFLATGDGSQPNLDGNQSFPHELGHNFNLIHTFGEHGGSGISGSGTTTEFVTRGAGANCTTDGDLICDTPADPYNMAGATIIEVNGCQQYDPTSTARDGHGDPYSPLISNIMSYYQPCTHDFTPGQYDRMQAALALRQTHTAYSLDAPPANMSAPSNLSATFTTSSVALTWQDNASNEMGYFIERSTSPTTGFVSIGGVGPNVTTFSDTKLPAQTVYYYRIRPSNTTTGSLSPTVNVVAAILVSGLTTTTITTTSAQLSWNSLGDGFTYDVQYRPIGASTWFTSGGIATANLTLNYLSSNTQYEWQVKSSTSDTYSGAVNFSTLCPVPQYSGSSPARVSAVLSWYGNNTPFYTLQWRQQGAADWTTISNLTTATYSLTGLTSTTSYEWRVQGVCSVTSTSDFTSPQSFTTTSCLAIYNTFTSTVKSNSALLYWSTGPLEPGGTYTVRYRPVGAVNWTTISSLTAIPYSLTGLINNTQYEWQVMTVCSATEHSDYSLLSTFTTFCLAPVGLSSTVGRTTAILYWGYNGPADLSSIYEVQYRVIGSASWFTMTGSTNLYNYASQTLTGLATNTTYESRVRTFCSITGQSDYSNTITFTTDCYAPALTNLNSYTVLSSSAQLSWSLLTDAGTTFEMRYRPVGSTTWNTVSSLTTTAYSLTGLTNNTQYEWQIRTLCSPTESSAFTASATFTTQCTIPASIYGGSTGLTSKILLWIQTEPGASYEIRYRLAGTTDWTTVSNLASASITLSALTSNTDYEWQVRAKCSDGLFSDFSSINTFHTYSCDTPNGLTATPFTQSARLNWSFYNADAATHYEIRYRTLGATDWITLSNLTSSGGVGSVDLPGLPNNTNYEWQIRTLCSGTESSAFTGSSYFTTQCHLPVGLYATPHATSAQLNWLFAYANADTRYEGRYRVVGTTNWITVGNLSSDNGYGSFVLTGLTNNTSYEWQIRTLCSATESSDFTGSSYFATQCVIPTSLYATTQVYSATLAWYEPGNGLGYEVRYRLIGTTNWTTVSNLTVRNITVSGLTNNTSYEWQVRTLCSDNIVSDFSTISSFTTTSCSAPVNVSTTGVTSTSARLNWSFPYADANTRYEARYRVVGAPNWIILSNLTSNYGSGYTTLAGLTENTQYEWQIRTLCSPTESSDFNSSVTFRTVNTCLNMYTIKIGSWNDPTVWSCNRIPTSSDVVQIKHLVTLPAGFVANAKQVGYNADQSLNFGANSQLRIGL